MRRPSLLMAIAFVGCCGLAFAQSQTPSSHVTKMKGFVADISELTEKNSDFRRVLYTGKNMQLVLMSLKPGEDIGEEVHDNVDQFFRIEEGSGEVVINGQSSIVKSDYAQALVIMSGIRGTNRCDSIRFTVHPSTKTRRCM